jgi:hypothetical protein
MQFPPPPRPRSFHQSQVLVTGNGFCSYYLHKMRQTDSNSAKILSPLPLPLLQYMTFRGASTFCPIHAPSNGKLSLTLKLLFQQLVMHPLYTICWETFFIRRSSRVALRQSMQLFPGIGSEIVGLFIHGDVRMQDGTQ